MKIFLVMCSFLILGVGRASAGSPEQDCLGKTAPELETCVGELSPDALLGIIKAPQKPYGYMALEEAAANAVLAYGEQARGIVPDLLRLSGGDCDPVVREILRKALSNIGVTQQDVDVAMSDIIKILKTSRFDFERTAAAETLGMCGKKAEAAVPALLESAAGDIDWATRERSLVAIRYIGLSAKQAVYALPRLKDIVGDDSCPSCASAARGVLLGLLPMTALPGQSVFDSNPNAFGYSR